jgi:hypothetical protein
MLLLFFPFLIIFLLVLILGLLFLVLLILLSIELDVVGLLYVVGEDEILVVVALHPRRLRLVLYLLHLS